MMRTDYQSLAVTIEGLVCQVQLNRPDTRNAIDHQMHDELTDLFGSVSAGDDVRVIVLSAAGSVFCAGGDFDLILADRADPSRRDRLRKDGEALFHGLTQCPLPLVVALHGEAVGLGATLVLGADAVVASRNARLSDPHVVIGLAAGDGGCALWPQVVGFLRAKRYLLTGDRLNAEQAHAMGLVTDLVDTPEEVLNAAMQIARRIAALPPLAVQATKRALNAGFRAQTEEAFRLGLEAEMDTFFSDDVGEAIAAFRERRPGVFKGC